MIPIHDFVDKHIQAIRVVKLNALTEYDTTQPHRHNYFELFIFDKGEGIHDIDFTTFEIVPKSIHIVAPGQVHQVRRELDTNGYVILFDMAQIQSDSAAAEFLFDHMSYSVNEFNPTYIFSGKIAEQVMYTAETIWSDYNSDNNLKNEFLKNHLNLLCITCLRSVSENSFDKSPNDDTYRKFRQLLRSNFKTIKKVKEYASTLGVSDKKLNEIVQRKTGLTCSALIYNQVILEAKRLLNTNLSAKEVAFELAFEDPAHFSKFFKSQTGISPSQFQHVHD